MNAVEKCMICGSENISRDYEKECYVCNNCGSAEGGANFWE